MIAAMAVRMWIIWHQGRKGSMTKAELITRMAKDAALTKQQSAKVLEALIGSVTEALRHGERVTLVGFGTFGLRARGSRTARHPRTGQALWIPARKTPTFKPGKGLRTAIR
jgi:DNA-binding protein HU-beta